MEREARAETDRIAAAEVAACLEAERIEQERLAAEEEQTRQQAEAVEQQKAAENHAASNNGRTSNTGEAAEASNSMVMTAGHENDTWKNYQWQSI